MPGSFLGAGIEQNTRKIMELTFWRVNTNKYS